MPGEKDDLTARTTTDRHPRSLARRRLLQLAGVGLAGVGASGVAGASGEEMPHAIVFDGTAVSGQVAYEFGVSGSVAPHGRFDSIESHDDVGGESVSGSVDGDRDAYRFSGDLTHLDVAGAIEVTVRYGDAGHADPDRLTVVAPRDSAVEYALEADGRVEKNRNSGYYSANDNDAVTRDGEESAVSGWVGYGYGDTYDVYGAVTSFEASGEDVTLLLNGEPVSPAELTGGDPDGTPDVAEFRVGFHHDDWLEYAIHVDAEPAPLTAGEDEHFAASNYDVTHLDDGTWLVEGRTGTADPSGPMYGDGYRWEPESGNGILGWAATAPGDRTYHVSVNGEELDPAALPALDRERSDDSGAGTADGGPIGGGEGYARTVAQPDADAVVRTRGELASALSGASAGDVVFVSGDATIDVGSGGLHVPSGVTVASDRGVDDAPGALLHTTREADECLILHGSARLTGVRLRGPHAGADFSGSSYAGGVELHGPCEVDNCDVWGFSHHGVRAVSGGDAHVHHNVVRECNKSGLGYGVGAGSGTPVIEYNYFDFNRHSVTTAGENPGYVCRYNHFGPDLTSHVIDMHDPAGTRYEVHNNVVEGYVDHAGERRPAVAVRGVPDDVALIRDNWFWNPEPPGSSPSYTWTDEAIIQPETGSSWASVSFSGNHYGEDAGVSFGDVIPGYDGGRS